MIYFGVVMTIIWLLLSIVCGIGAEDALPGYRLPQDIIPSFYKLRLTTDLDAFTFNGDVEIKVKCLKATNSIHLHAKDLVIPEGSLKVDELTENEASPMTVSSTKEVPENDFFIIKLSKSLKMNKEYLLHIPFSGNITENLVGYYRSSYLDRTENKTKWLGATQFQPMYARTAFPCFDEPGMKAQFTIQLSHKEKFKAISNMPQIKQTPMDDRKGWVWTYFEQSVPMSTYLVAWVVSEFEFKESPQLGNVTFRIWAREEAIGQVDFASEVGPKVLSYYEQLFGMKYPLPKMDMVAIPDFNEGAMENWGLMTYRETNLLFVAKHSSIKAKERLVQVIAHELAHQWFGNLVTMKWWTDLWLNEGFASYVEKIGVNHVFPEWNNELNKGLHAVAEVFAIDSLSSSHKISPIIGHPSEIDEIFDTISYRKGSTIIRMMHKFLGDSFFKGVSNYLKKNKFGNAEQDNLWEALTQQAHSDGVLDKSLTVKTIMDSWTLQTGYPVITVKRDYDKGTATLTQTRYLTIPDKVANNESCWWIPITYTTSKEANFGKSRPKNWFKCTPKENQLTITDLPKGKDNWLIFNIDLTALYRVHYDEHNWQLIIKTLKSDQFKTISPANRAGLIIDVFEFAERGDVPYGLAFDLISYLSRETEYLPFEYSFFSFTRIKTFLKRTPGYGVFKEYVKKVVSPFSKRFKSLEQQPVSLDEKKMHKLTSSWACALDEPDCISQAKGLYEKWTQTKDLDNNNPIPTDLRRVVFCTVVRLGDVKVWDKLWERYKTSNYGAEKRDILTSLGCSRDVWVINRYLDWSIDEKSDIRKQDAFTVFSIVISQENGFYLAKDFLHRRMKDIYKYNINKQRILGYYLKAYGSMVVYEYELQALKDFVNKSYFKEIKQSAAQALEKAESNVKWLQANYNDIIKMLSL